MNLFWTLMSAISNATTDFMTRCPNCGGKMERVEMHDQAYTRTRKSSSTFMSRSVTMRTAELGSRVFPKVQVIPVYDVCTACGHRVRRRDMKPS